MSRYKTALTTVAALFSLGSTAALAAGLGVGGNVGVGAGIDGGAGRTAGAIGADVGARGDVGVNANSNGLPSVDRDTGLDRATDRVDRIHQKASDKAGKLKSEKHINSQTDIDADTTNSTK